MEDYYEVQLDLTKAKIIELEKEITVLSENLMTVAEQIKETQRFIIKMAQNQAEITKRVSQWPYIAVPSERGDEDA